MKRVFFTASMLALSIFSFSQPLAEKQEILYGTVDIERLTAVPFDKWYTPGYNDYQPDAETITSLRRTGTRDVTIQVFLGTWCGDSKREVPRFMKVLSELSFPMNKIQIVTVGGSDSLYKQSPQHEETGKGIFRVPVFIIYKNGVEVNRINEYPALSLEKDLLTILSNKPYSPNYRSFETIKKWMADGTLTDKNITARSLAWQLKPLVGGENELNSLGYLLLRQERTEPALKILQANAVLYPESANVISSLGEGYYKNGDLKNAVMYLERSLELNKDPGKVKEILKVLYQVKGVKE